MRKLVSTVIASAFIAGGALTGVAIAAPGHGHHSASATASASADRSSATRHDRSGRERAGQASMSRERAGHASISRERSSHAREAASADHR